MAVIGRRIEQLLIGWGAGVDVNPAGDRAAAEDRQRQKEARDLLTDFSTKKGLSIIYM